MGSQVLFNGFLREAYRGSMWLLLAFAGVGVGLYVLNEYLVGRMLHKAIDGVIWETGKVILIFYAVFAPLIVLAAFALFWAFEAWWKYYYPYTVFNAL